MRKGLSYHWGGIIYWLSCFIGCNRVSLAHKQHCSSLRYSRMIDCFHITLASMCSNVSCSSSQAIVMSLEREQTTPLCLWGNGLPCLIALDVLPLSPLVQFVFRLQTTYLFVFLHIFSGYPKILQHHSHLCTAHLPQTPYIFQTAMFVSVFFWFHTGMLA